MKKIPLTKGKFAFVDDEDFESLNKWKWAYSSLGYAKRTEYLGGGRKNQKSRGFYMHRVILKTPKGFETDHINRNGIDNRKCNLRIVTRQQNGCNRALQPNNTSGYRGVTWHKDRKKWMAQIKAKRKHYYLGLFNNKKDAARAYNSAAIRHFGKFAEIN